MIGKIVQFENVTRLFVVVDYESRDQPYDTRHDKIFWVIPYDPGKDIFEIDLSKARPFHITTTHLGVKEAEHKLHYTRYGTSDIRGVKKAYFERIWEEVKTPER